MLSFFKVLLGPFSDTYFLHKHYITYLMTVSLAQLRAVISIFNCRDIGKNPGPRKLKKSFLVCHWNFNSLPAHNF